MGKPLNPIAAHLGAGVVQIYTLEESDGIPSIRYEVQAAKNLNGPYVSYSNSNFVGPDGWIYNFPIGNTIYLRIRSVYDPVTFSDWVQVKRGILRKPVVRMRCRAVRGSLIPEGAIFSQRKATDRIVGFKSLQDINFTV